MTMKQPTDKLNTNIFGMIVTIVGFGFVSIVAVIAFAAQDPLWFLTNFDERPARITIYHEGLRTELQRGDPDFAELAEAVRQSLSAWAGCVAGAVEAKEYIGMMEAVGFTNVSVNPVFFDKETVDSAMDEMKLDVNEYPREAVYKAVYSAKITAYKPT